MSFTGRLLRGLKYDLSRDNRGNLHSGVEKDANKMNDLNFFLDFVKDKERDKVEKALLNLRKFERSTAGNKLEVVKSLKALLNSDQLNIKPISKPKSGGK